MIKHSLSSGLTVRTKIIEESFQKIKEWGYSDLNYDAQFKWANIIHEFHQYFGKEPSNLKILDIGGGLGPLDMYFSNYGTCLNIDLNFEKTWFPTNTEKILSGSNLRYDKNNLNRIEGDARKILNSIDYKFDFIYDSCSLIHLSRVHNKKNTAITPKLLGQIFKLLSKVSHDSTLIISSTDIACSKKFEINDFLYQQRILNAAIDGGLNYHLIVSENDYLLKPSMNPIQRNGTSGNIFKLDKNRINNIQNYLSMYWPENLKIRTKIIVIVIKFNKNNGQIIKKLRLPFWRRIASFLARSACRIESRYFS
jgi:hypothetical protein